MVDKPTVAIETLPLGDSAIIEESDQETTSAIELMISISLSGAFLGIVFVFN